MDIKVLITDPKTGALSPGIPRPPQRVKGIEKLVQIVVLQLLSNGGRSIFSPSQAGGARMLIGTSVDFEDPSELFADVRLVISRIEQNIKQSQSLTQRPPDERLSELQMIDIVPDEETLSINVVIGVVNEEQQVGQALVALR